MKRYTVFDPSLGRYVVPLPKPQGEPPFVKMQIGGPQDLLFGEVVDHLAELEMAVERAEKVAAEGRLPRLCECPICFYYTGGESNFCPNCGTGLRREEADRC